MLLLFVALYLWEKYIFNLGHWDFSFQAVSFHSTRKFGGVWEIEFYCEKLTFIYHAIGAALVKGTFTQVRMTAAFTSLTWYVLSSATFSAVHFTVLFWLYISTQTLLRTVVYMMESISPTLYYRKWQLFTALLPQKHSRTGELWILFHPGELFHSLRATSHFP